MRTLDEYLTVLDKLFLEAKDQGAVCLKTTLAYQRTLRFENVPQERAEAAFGKRAAALSAEEIKDFEDFIMWRLCELSQRYELPFQIHTGQARIQGSNPMLLVDMIEAHPGTNFILFHGGYPWVDDMAVILQKSASHVWVDSCWLPMLSYSTAKRAFHEWLDAFPSNRIMWGRRLQSRRRHLRRDRVYPPLCRRSARREGRSRRPPRGPRSPHRANKSCGTMPWNCFRN